jgi:iron-sulfur cluster assembly protein
MAVSMTPAAAGRVKALMMDQKLDAAFLRMGVRGGGCSGMTYDLQFDSELRKHDKEFDVEGVKVVVDVKSYLYLNGTTLDYVTQGLTGGFTFVNPKAKSSCGCGTSFTA